MVSMCGGFVCFKIFAQGERKLCEIGFGERLIVLELYDLEPI